MRRSTYLAVMIFNRRRRRDKEIGKDSGLYNGQEHLVTHSAKKVHSGEEDVKFLATAVKSCA